MIQGKIDPDVKKLILWRIEIGVPAHFKLVMGGDEPLNKEEMKIHVEKEDAVGREIISMELKFIKALSSGEFSKTLLE